MTKVLPRLKSDDLLWVLINTNSRKLSKDFDNSPAAVEARLEQERWVREHTYSLLEA